MKLLLILSTCITLIPALTKSADPSLENEEIEARAFLQHLNRKTADRLNRQHAAQWLYESNITDTNLKAEIAALSQIAKETKADWLETMKYHWRTFKEEDLRRQFKKFSLLEKSALPDKKVKKISKIIADMKKIYSTTKLCDYHNSSKCDIGVEPELEEKFASLRNPDELKHLWVSWHNATGQQIKEMFKEYVELQNEAARLNNYTDNAEYWLDSYETEDIKGQLQNLWTQIKPLYLQIHAYIRFKLRNQYGDIVPERGPIPAHLLGNIWSQTWGNIANFTFPYPNKQVSNVNDEMKKQGYTPLRMFQMANEFFVSINLTGMPTKFWKNSIIEKPSDGRELVCHATAWDFYEAEDFRIKMCTKITEEDFFTVHHEMGHIEYFMQYSQQPAIYREGANDGFHEAVGDVMSLSVTTRKHLRKIGLIRGEHDEEEVLLNNLFMVGLSKVVLLPFAYILDLWRWNVFSGKISPEKWNCEFWKLRLDYQGIEPPVNRTEDDFDPAGKFHIIADVPYIRYFISNIIQFQFHRSLCQKAGQYDERDASKPLHECDIYQSTEAGNALGKMLQLGSSRPWPDAMEALTDQRELDASALLEYFKPLQIWLEQENRKNGVHLGWDQSDKECEKLADDQTRK